MWTCVDLSGRMGFLEGGKQGKRTWGRYDYDGLLGQAIARRDDSSSSLVSPELQERESASFLFLSVR